jgi:hypothetical protein
MRTYEFQIDNVGIPHLPMVKVRLADDPVWSYAPCVKQFKDERPVEMFQGWSTIAEAERIHAKIGEAIRIAKEAQK